MKKIETALCTFLLACTISNNVQVRSINDEYFSSYYTRAKQQKDTVTFEIKTAPSRQSEEVRHTIEIYKDGKFFKN